MQPRKRHYTVEEYFALDDAAPEGVRLEYEDGTIYLNGQYYDPEWGWEVARDMAGALPVHSRIRTNLTVSIANQTMARGCDVLTSDQQVPVDARRYVYSDLVMSCHPSYEGMFLLNPELVVEILSTGSVERDTGQKLDAYRAIASVDEYWIVYPGEVRVTRYYRKEDGWGFESYVALERMIESERLQVAVPLGEIYRGIL